LEKGRGTVGHIEKYLSSRLSSIFDRLKCQNLIWIHKGQG